MILLAHCDQFARLSATNLYCKLFSPLDMDSCLDVVEGEPAGSGCAVLMDMFQLIQPELGQVVWCPKADYMPAQPLLIKAAGGWDWLFVKKGFVSLC